MRAELIKKIIDESYSVHNAIISTIRRFRYTKFCVRHWSELLDAKRRVSACFGQNELVIDTFKLSAELHFSIISSLTDTIECRDEPLTETLQAPVIVELIRNYDDKIDSDTKKFTIALEEHWRRLEAIVLSRCLGRFNLHWSVDYIPTPGSLANAIMTLAEKAGLSSRGFNLILTCTTAARVTAYQVMYGYEVMRAMLNGDSLRDALDVEKDLWIRSWREPTLTEKQVLRELNFSSFDYGKYMEKFRDGIDDIVKKSLASGADPSNIVLVSVWGAGDFHHIGQSIYNVCRDDVAFSILAKVGEAALNSSLLNTSLITELNYVPIRELTAAATAYIMRQDGITASMLLDLLTKWYVNYNMIDPLVLLRENLIAEFIEYLALGERILDRRDATFNKVRLDLSPIDEDDVLNSIECYSAFPTSPVLTRLASLLKFASDPFHLESDPLISVVMTNLIALRPDEPIVPVLRCRNCFISSLLPSRCRYCAVSSFKH